MNPIYINFIYKKTTKSGTTTDNPSSDKTTQEEARQRLEQQGKNNFGGNDIQSFVIRSGSSVILNSHTEIVIGDLIELKAGYEVPAEIRLIYVSSDFRVEESILTGVSEGQAKQVRYESISLSEQGDFICYAKSNVQCGEAMGIAYGTGRNTAIGKVAKLLPSNESGPKGCCLIQ
jgi:magnesium-transporting ATPase (P-type)